MPELKIRDGHSSSVRGCIAYLTKDGRAIASDFINCCEVDNSGRKVWEQMDLTRERFQTDKPDLRTSNGRMRTFEHLIVSPDPKDGIDLPTLQTLCTSWAEKHFGDFEVAIYYHDDNRGNIPHAHIVVNGTSIRDGERIASRLVGGRERRMNDDLQEMAREMGLRAFESTAARSEGRRGSPVPETIQDEARTREEHAIVESGGYSWKEDIRQRMTCAVKLSRSSSEFIESCEALGMGVREDRRGEWVFSLANHPTWQVTGKRLGFDYSRFGIERWLAHERASRRPKISSEAASLFRSAIAPIVAAGGPSLAILGVIDGRKFTVKEVADMLDLCEDFDIRSMDDFHDASVGPMSKEARENLRASWRLARGLGYLPEHRQRIDGERLKGDTDYDSFSSTVGLDIPVQSGIAPELAHMEIEER